MGLSLGSPCQQASIIPYLAEHVSHVRALRDAVISLAAWSRSNTDTHQANAHISGEALSGALILVPSLSRLQKSSSIWMPGYGDAPIGT